MKPLMANKKYDRCLKHGHTWEWCDNGTFSEFEADMTCKVCGATAYVTGDVRTADLRYIEYDLD